MGAWSSPVLDQDLTFSGDASTSGNTVYFPNSVKGHYTEFIVYIKWSAGTSAGAVQIETADPFNYAGTWAAVGSPVSWAAASSQGYAQVTGVFSGLRLRISTTVTGGTVSAHVIASSPD